MNSLSAFPQRKDTPLLNHPLIGTWGVSRRAGGWAMTAIIATICHDEKAVVVVADRGSLASMGGARAMFTSPISKIHVTPNGHAIGIAGDAEDGVSMVSRMPALPLSEIASWILKERKLRQRNKIEMAKLTSPVARHWLDLAKADSDSAVRALLEQNIAPNNLDFIIAGIDEGTGRPRLWALAGNDEVCASLDNSGFVAIGEGTPAALFSLTRWAKEMRMTLPSAIYAAVEAKKDSELTPGIGVTTDVVILRHAMTPLFVEENDLEPLYRVYKTMRPDRLSSESQQILRDVIAKLSAS